MNAQLHFSSAPTPATRGRVDPRRASLLRELGILDSEPEASFDGLTQAARLLTGCPIALVSLLDEHRQWFKSKQGLTACETPIAWSFCVHAARQEDLFEVEDARADVRFATNPLVTGEPHIRFYAGVPLKLDGVSLGTLCVIDNRPRRLSSEVRLALEGLARAVEGLIAAQQAARLRSEVLSRVSHELRTPLNAVVGFAQLLMRDPQDVTLYATHIHRAGTHLLALVNDMLNLARLETGRTDAESQPVSTAHVMQRCLDLLKPDAHRQDVSLFAVTGPEAEVVMADQRGLTQALLNLAGNALKFSPPGSGVNMLAHRVPDDRVHIDVTDQGPGIAPEMIPLLFQPFSQLPGARKSKGTGLGLAISRQLVQAMGGDISVRSEVGVGSTFTIALDAAEPGLPAAVDSAHAVLEGHAVSPTARWLRVLYIEDDPVNALLIEHMLAHFGQIHLHHAATADEGLQQALSRPLDLILLDMNLPDGHGLDVLKRLRADERTASVPVVALSADALPDSIGTARAAGFDDYLTKPIDMTRLERLMTDLR
ncbi:MAG: ATP-binding protein [Burkholderiaceae bacterium]|nr:ATP-binding protein [Burkholderiaceae bacterium]